MIIEPQDDYNYFFGCQLFFKIIFSKLYQEMPKQIVQCRQCKADCGHKTRRHGIKVAAVVTVPYNVILTQ